MINVRALARKAADEMFAALPESIQDCDIAEAIDWARETLTNHEGSGHSFYLHTDKPGLFRCSFAKPKWASDHCSDHYDDASKAIVMAVCEYLSGC